MTSNREYPYSFSLDVVSLYNSIPVYETVNNVAQRIGSTHIRNFNRDDIASLLKVVLDNVYFIYNTTIYRQITGLPMGSSVSGILVILFMDILEKNALTSDCHIEIYSRYVDDVYLQNRSLR